MAEIRVPGQQQDEPPRSDNFHSVILSNEEEPYSPTFQVRSRPNRYQFKRPPADDIDKEIARQLEAPITEPVNPSLQVQGDQGRINRARTTSATLDIPFRMAYEGDDTLKKQLEQQDESFFSKAGTSFMRGVGNTMLLAGRALELGTPTNSEAGRLGLMYRDYGQRLQQAYLPKQRPEEFTWDKVLTKDWWATTAAESVPTTLALIPAAIVGAYSAGGIATGLGLGAFGQTVLTALGGAAFSRVVEGGFEAAGTYEEAIGRGKSSEEAHSAAQTTFLGNLALTGVDATQFALAFTPLKLLGAAPKILQNRLVATALRFGVVAALEAGEEVVQEGIQQYSLGDPVSLTPQMKESGVLGAIFGVGLGGVGSVYEGIVGTVESKMSVEQMVDYEAMREQALNAGASEEGATLQALDQFAEAPGGKETINKAFKELKDLSEGREVEPVGQDEMQKGIDNVEQVIQQQEQPEAIGDEVINSIVSGESQLEELFGLEKLPVEPVVRGGVDLKPSEVKPAIRLTTGQEKLAKVIREDVALSAALRKASMAARIAFKAGSEKATIAAKAEFQNVLTLAKVKAEAIGFKEGKQHGQKITKQELLASFKDSQKEMEATRKALTELIQEELPLAERGKYLDALISRLTRAKQEDVLDRVIEHKERLTHKELVDELSDIQHFNGDKIPVEYQRRLQEIVGDINTKKFSQATVQKLLSLRNYADEEGMPSGVSYRTLSKLDALAKKQAGEMTIEDLQDLTATANHLIAMGKLKQDLKYKYNERQRQAALTKLVDSTVNADFDTTKSGGKLARQAQDLHIRTLNAIRATEIFDGFKSGENVKLAKELIFADKNAQWAARLRLTDAMEELQAAGVTELTDDQNVRLMINIRNQEGAEAATLALMKKYNFQEVPDLTRQEQKVIDILKKYSDMDVDKIAALYEERENQPFAYLPNRVLPLKYENEVHLPPAEAIQHHYRTAQTDQGFTEARKKGVQKIPRVDVLSIFEQGLQEQTWYVHTQPVIDNINQLVKTKPYLNKAGEVATQWWSDHLDIVSRRGWSANADHKPFSQLLRQTRGNISKAILGYKLSSILMQPFAIFDAMAYAQTTYGTAATKEVMKEFAKSWIVPGYASNYINGTPALQMRQGGELAIEEILSGKKLNKFMQGGLSLLLKADVITAAGAQQAMENVLTKQGIPNAKQEAALLMEMSASSSDVSFRSHILASGEAARTWFTFQNFMLNRWGMISHDLITKGLVKGDAKAKISAAVGLGIIVAATLAENEARKYLYETILRREKKVRSLFTDAVLAIPSQIPFFGDIYQTVSGNTGDIPVVKLVTDVMRAATIPFTDKKAETKAKEAMRAAEAALTLTTGVPGTAQLFDVLEGQLFPGKPQGNKPKAQVPGQAARP